MPPWPLDRCVHCRMSQCWVSGSLWAVAFWERSGARASVAGGVRPSPPCPVMGGCRSLHCRCRRWVLSGSRRALLFALPILILASGRWVIGATVLLKGYCSRHIWKQVWPETIRLRGFGFTGVFMHLPCHRCGITSPSAGAQCGVTVRVRLLCLPPLATLGVSLAIPAGTSASSAARFSVCCRGSLS